jgi:hypothetical protein
MNPLDNSRFDVDNSLHIDLVRKRMKEIGPIYPVKPLPNVRKFKIAALSNHDAYLASEAGILKREFSPLIESESYSNKRLNRYVKWQFIRLNAARDNSRLFWCIGSNLLHHSVAYKATCITNVFPG